ncbi:hypothetical protein IVB34_01605 [Bradyrhizobium sp. 2]|nr:hypothetical protein [Bradyrhizobium sp. 2]MCK1457089.1 hypothetical protein [Bradyrhizobium sp. 2]
MAARLANYRDALFGNRDGMKSIRPCAYSYDLDLKALIWTRGAPFPVS